MGKFFQRAGGSVGLCVTDADEARYLPADAAATADFDETTNPQVIADFQAAPARFTFVGGGLRRDGVAVTFAADSAARSDRIGFRAEAAQAYQDNQTFLAVNSPTNAQNAAQVKALTRQMQRVVRLLGQLDSRGVL